jgi:hypothetical protein
MSYPSYDQAGNASQETLAGSTAVDAASVRMPDGHKEDAGVVEYGVPPEYPSFEVPDAAPVVNPSAGDVGPVEEGANDVNPQGGPVPDLQRGAHGGPQAPDNANQRGTTGYGR